MDGVPPAGLRVSGAAELGPELLELAIEAARLAGGLLAERFSLGEQREVTSKSTPTDLVSEADLASERAIRELLFRRRPQDGLIGEEGDERPGESGLRWIVDPLDGTVNFIFGIPQWCVSIAVSDERGTLAGVVFDPCRDELFSARREQPSTLTVADGVPKTLSGSAREDLSTAMVATGFAYDASVRAGQAELVARLLPRVRDIRRFGSAALDLAWTAAGRYDAYFEHGVKLWDVAAGALICERAGLDVRALEADERLPPGLYAGAPALSDPLLALIG